MCGVRCAVSIIMIKRSVMLQYYFFLFGVGNLLFLLRCAQWGVLICIHIDD